jgi:hypothetical protein
MKTRINLVAGLAALALLCVASVSPSHAATTAYVSGQAGANDGNPCTLALPCRTIGHAVTTAGTGGTVSCLDSGPYSEGFSTSLSYTLDCRGVVYIQFGNTFEFGIQAAGQVVTYRHVIFDGAPGGEGAVQIQGGKVVFEHCTFQNWTPAPAVGIQFAPSVALAQLTVTDSVFTHNGSASGGGGIVIQPSAGGTAAAVIERTQITDNTYGIVANGSSGTVLVDIRYSSVAGNTFDGIWAYTTGSVASIVVDHGASVQNGGGIHATGANAFVSLNDSTVAWNSLGLATSSGGTILSYKNNVIAGNLNPGVTPTGINQQ